MFRLLFLLSFVTLSLFARYDAYPTQSCPAFNNLKHTKNTHSVILDTDQQYTVLKKHKGQYLILVKGESPAQRWVDDACFDHRIVSKQERADHATYQETAVNTKFQKSKDNILALTWHNAYCETHRYKKECSRSFFSFGKDIYKEKHFVLHGLWPQPKYHVYCDVDRSIVYSDKHGHWKQLPQIDIHAETRKRLEKVMPGYTSGLHKHEWIKHGTCYGADMQTYFEDAVSLTEQLNRSKVGTFFTSNIGKYVTLHQVRFMFDRTFGLGSGRHVELRCNKGMISELWLHIGSGSDDLGKLLNDGKITRSSCQGGIVDRAGFR